MSEPPPQELDPHLEQATPGAYPGGLVQEPKIVNSQIGTPTGAVHLGYIDDLGPTEVHFVGSWTPLVLDEPEGVVVNTDGEVMFVLDVYLNAGVARRHKCRTRHISSTLCSQLATPNFNHIMRYPVDREGRGRRARNDVITLARSNKLSVFVSLDYADMENGQHEDACACDHMFGLFLRRLRRVIRPLSWIEVLEYGVVNGRLHHHVLLSPGVDDDLIHAKWTFGQAVIKHLNDLSAIGKTASYMTEDFEEPEVERPRRSRYRVARNIHRERPIRFIGSRDDLKAELLRHVPRGTKLKAWESTHQHSDGGFTWNQPV